jgi:hypothetical protein
VIRKGRWGHLLSLSGFPHVGFKDDRIGGGRETSPGTSRRTVPEGKEGPLQVRAIVTRTAVAVDFCNLILSSC